ncbi:MAG: bifunctional methylenetetrahydrofolate dehydrogenase/methenyltetrahydrofolate cyclohydrolase FolD [Clostridia bacterium]|nr:bifunctional methylenetetrahydrofolate dehydrogenase/methenyltetrahydrofolate cyclohydrolase FolD [Clostridia bacterium]
MTCMKIDGKAIALSIREEIAARVEALKEKGVTPGLAVILVGNDPASEIYVRNKGIACEKAGMRSEIIRLPEDTTQEALESEIARSNADGGIDGILVQLPLPKHLDERRALNAILPEKDVDGFHPVNAGKLLAGEKTVVPCTPKGCMRLLAEAGIETEGKEAVVIGRSNIVGKPMALLLTQANCTVTVCHTRTRDLKAHTRRADILVSSVGKAGFVTPDMVKPGAAVIDVGISRVDGKVCGDVAPEVAEVAGALTPVPGGVGPMTIAMLLENAVEAAECRA